MHDSDRRAHINTSASWSGIGLARGECALGATDMPYEYVRFLVSTFRYGVTWSSPGSTSNAGDSIGPSSSEAASRWNREREEDEAAGDLGAPLLLLAMMPAACSAMQCTHVAECTTPTPAGEVESLILAAPLVWRRLSESDVGR